MVAKTNKTKKENQTKKKTTKTIDYTKEKFNDAFRDLENRIKENPIKSTLIALGVGVAIGSIINSDFNKKTKFEKNKDAVSNFVKNIIKEVRK